MSKKTEKQIKQRKPEKKITEKTEPWKKTIKPIKILKKPTSSVRFRFYKPETKKTKPNPNRTEQNWKNRAKSVFVQKNRTELKPVGLNRFLFFFLNSV